MCLNLGRVQDLLESCFEGVGEASSYSFTFRLRMLDQLPEMQNKGCHNKELTYSREKNKSRPSKLIVVGPLLVQVDHQGVSSHDLAINLPVRFRYLT